MPSSSLDWVGMACAVRHDGREQLGWYLNAGGARGCCYLRRTGRQSTGWYSSSNKVTLPSTDPRTRSRILSRILPVAETVKGQQLALSVWTALVLTQHRNVLWLVDLLLHSLDVCPPPLFLDDVLPTWLRATVDVGPPAEFVFVSRAVWDVDRYT
jgi:hypothetical protein